MKLAKAVVDKNGLLLCNKGTKLDETIISRLSNMGIKKIIVKGHPVETIEAEGKPLEIQLEELEMRFEKVASDPVMSVIKDIFEKKLREKMDSGK